MVPNEPVSSANVRERLAVLALTLLALGLRVWGIEYGFPQPWARPDEDRWVRIALGLLEDPNPRWFQWPTFHAYLLAVFYWAWGKYRVWHGDFPSFHAYLNEPQDVYLVDQVLLGRLICAIIGALAVPLVWKLAERVGPRGSGLFAAFLLAVSFGPVRDAHWALIESFLLAGIVLSLLVALRALEKPTLGRFVWAGFVAGLTTSAKYSGVTLAAPIALAVCLARWREGRPLAVVGSLWDARSLASAAAMSAGFFAGSPFILASWPQFVDAMAIREWSYRDASFGTDIGFLHHILFSLRYSHGLLLEVVGVVSLLVLGWRTPARALVTIYGLATYLALGPARIIPMRYASSLAPCIVLAAVWAVFDASGRVRAPRLVVGLAALLLAAEPAYRDMRFGMLLTREDTRVTAREWLDARAPAGTRILSRESKTLRWGRPLLEDRYEVVPFLNRRARRAMAPYALLAEAPTGYVPWAPDMHAVLQSTGTVVALFDPFGPKARPVYDPHDAFFVPVAGFGDVRMPGPRITIYQVHTRPPDAP